MRSQLAPSLGESLIDTVGGVEDTKGNNGIKGTLSITQLRIIWISHKSDKVNLCIGLGCIEDVSIRTAFSKVRGQTNSLYVMSKYQESRFEFIFTSMIGSPRLYTTVISVFRAYESSRLFRELKLRGALVKDQTVKLLPDEEICLRVPGVWNLSQDQGNLGSFVITNIRVVWFAKLAESFNVSIPFLQIKETSVKHSKFGNAFVVETFERGGQSFKLGFRIEPPEAHDEANQVIRNLHSLYSKKPNFGVHFSIAQAPKSLADVTTARKQDNFEIVNEEEFFPASFRGSGPASYHQSSSSENANPVFNEYLGVAMVPLTKGVTPQSLWTLNK